MPRPARRIGKTRHAPHTPGELAGKQASKQVVINSGVGPARGVLRRQPPAGFFWHSRTASPASLSSLVEHFWIVRWDLSGQPPFEQQTLPHPSVHLVVEDGAARIVGPPTGRFVTLLEGRGRVFGTKFKPGGFYPFFGKPIVELTNTVRPLATLFGTAATSFEAALREPTTEDAPMIAAAVRLLEAHWPAPDPTAERVSHIVASIVADRAINSVTALVDRVGLGQRALQRLFERYVGVTPKWVIQRYRLHDAVEQLVQGMPDDWAAFALSLGYFDQAHFIRDFKALVGRTPREFALEEGQQ